MTSADPHYWLGYLAATMQHAAKHDETLQHTLEAFTASPACTPELRKQLAPKRRATLRLVRDKEA